jgi:two-component system, NarL family, response regulator DegU
MKKFNILLADDNKHFLQALKFLLEHSNMNKIEAIYEAHNGQEALNILKTYHIDIAFMDIEMPGINGIDVTRKATEQNRFLTVIALSFHQEMEFIKKMMEAGARNYIIKEEICTEVLENVINQNIFA